MSESLSSLTISKSSNLMFVKRARLGEVVKPTLQSNAIKLIFDT